MGRLDIELIDMHNHILFGVDDGAQDLETSLEMIRIAYEDGIRSLLLTPHCHPRRGMAPVEDIYEHFEILREAANQKFPDMMLFLGREVYYSSENIEVLAEREDLRINGAGNVLVEFSTNTPAAYISNTISDITLMGFTPIVAHIERYACIIEHKHLIEEIKSKGAYIQVNADSVMGENGYAVQKIVKWLLKNELIDFIASDAHDTSNRTPELSKCYQYVAKKYGNEYAYELFCGNAIEILEEE